MKSGCPSDPPSMVGLRPRGGRPYPPVKGKPCEAIGAEECLLADGCLLGRSSKDGVEALRLEPVLRSWAAVASMLGWITLVTGASWWLMFPLGKPFPLLPLV